MKQRSSVQISAGFMFVIWAVSPLLAKDPPPTSFNFDKYPDCKPAAAGTDIVPKLSHSFAVRVEGKTNVTEDFDLFDSEGYYEKDEQRGATIVYQDGVKHVFLYDFISGDAFSIEGETCQKGELFKLGCNAYAVFIAEISGHSSVIDKCSFQAGSTVYLGTGNASFTVRDIPVRKWAQCLYDGKKEILTYNEYYFVAEHVKTPSGDDVMPIRFTSRVLQLISDPKPTTTPNNTQMYDFTYYLPQVVDESVFLPPPGVFCPGWNRQNKTMPTLPNQLALGILTFSEKGQQLHDVRMNFDYKKQLVAFESDSQDGPTYPPASKTDNKSPRYRTVHDYDSGLSFVQPLDSFAAGSTTGCVITPIANTSLDSRGNTSASLHIRHGASLFGLNRKGWVYIGQREFNAIPCDVYSRPRENDAALVTEVYWSLYNWSRSDTPVLIGLMMYNHTANETYKSSFTEYDSYPFQFSIFSVTPCIATKDPLNLVFDLKLANYNETMDQYTVFEDNLRVALSNLLNTSALRLMDITITEGSPDINQAHVWVTIFEWPNVKGGRPGAPVQKSSTDVAKDLQKLLAGKDINLNITISGKNETVTILQDTFKYGSDLVAPTTTPRPQPVPTPAAIVTETGYTSGSMAGLAFAMIIIGGVAGLVAGFLLWKRNTGIAYQVYD